MTSATPNIVDVNEAVVHIIRSDLDRIDFGTRRVMVIYIDII